jgi:hypothetical protein
MIYTILEKKFEIYSIQKPPGYHGSVFEVSGSESLREIGLEIIFWFKSQHGFSNDLPESNLQYEICKPGNENQGVLQLLLEECIRNGKLDEQFNY